MNAQFTFPPPQAPTPRPGPGHKSGETAQTNSRESNGLRASVLDAALELGLVSNPLVADWMFNNTLAEEDEGEVRQSFVHCGHFTSNILQHCGTLRRASTNELSTVDWGLSLVASILDLDLELGLDDIVGLNSIILATIPFRMLPMP
ncbi:hypothetical protein BDZ97DRAFT_1076161 [Flammula alnicola]|nr:hypothetical protein BDZ97DRAFT_1076161 [Flammula alnicola]